MESLVGVADVGFPGQARRLRRWRRLSRLLRPALLGGASRPSYCSCSSPSRRYAVLAGGLAKVAGAHWSSAAAAGAFGWLTSLSPVLAAGWFAGYVELRYISVSISDIATLMRYSRPVVGDGSSAGRVRCRCSADLVVALTNVGSAIASLRRVPGADSVHLLGHRLDAGVSRCLAGCPRRDPILVGVLRWRVDDGDPPRTELSVASASASANSGTSSSPGSRSDWRLPSSSNGSSAASSSASSAASRVPNRQHVRGQPADGRRRLPATRTGSQGCRRPLRSDGRIPADYGCSGRHHERLVGFIFAAPGAVYHRGVLTEREHGLIALAGPVTNLLLLVAFAPVLVVGVLVGSDVIQLVGSRGLIINAFLAAFNMLPLGSLDGKTVQSWSTPVFAGGAVDSARRRRAVRPLSRRALRRNDALLPPPRTLSGMTDSESEADDADSEEGLTYAETGVDIDASEAATKALIGAAGEFKGDYAGLVDIGDQYLALATDGVGTKLLVAEAVDDYSTIGIDCIAMNANDLIATGVEPVAFVDYLAVETPDEKTSEDIGAGLRTGAERADVALVGGETAVMPDVIKGLDIAGTCAGLAPKDAVFPGEAEAGDAIVGWPSSASTPTDSRSLVRRSRRTTSTPTRPADPDTTIAEALSTPTRIYSEVLATLRAGETHAAAHVTGGGWTNLDADGRVPLRRDDAFDPQPVFEFVQERGGVSDEEMHTTFNMGTGFVAAVPEENAAALSSTATTVASSGRGRRRRGGLRFAASNSPSNRFGALTKPFRRTGCHSRRFVRNPNLECLSMRHLAASLSAVSRAFSSSVYSGSLGLAICVRLSLVRIDISADTVFGFSPSYGEYGPLRLRL